MRTFKTKLGLTITIELPDDVKPLDAVAQRELRWMIRRITSLYGALGNGPRLKIEKVTEKQIENMEYTRADKV